MADEKGRLWYVASIKPCDWERLVLAPMRSRGFEAMVPVITHRDFFRLREILHRRPAFGWYAFVFMDILADNWRALLRMDHVDRFLPVGCEIPSPLPVGLVEELQARPELDYVAAAEIARKFAAGDAAEIVDGLLRGMVGDVLSSNLTRTWLTLRGGRGGKANVETAILRHA